MVVHQPFVPLMNTATVEMKYICDGQHMENVYHFVVGELNQARVDSMSDYLVNTWEATIARHLRCPNTSWYGITIRDAAVQDGAVFTPQPSGPFAGTAAGAPLPNHVTAAIKHITGRGGRSFRGRSYWIGLTEAQVILNTLGADVAGNLVTAMEGLISPAAKAACGDLAVASKRHDNAWRVDGGLTTLVTGFSCDPTVDSQRRRLPGRGS